MNPSPDLKLSQALWISNPAALLNIDFADASSIENNTMMTDVGLEMSAMGWRRVGAATIEYHITHSQEALAQAAVGAAQQAMQKLQADTEVKLNALRETVSKLQSLSWNGQTVQEMQDASVVSEVVYSKDKQPAEDWLDIIQAEQWKCVKTGCQLMVLDNGINRDSYWGDLFYDSDTQEYLFNCANDDPALSRYAGEDQYYISADTSEPNFTTSYAGFPRLFLFAADDADLSEALTTYIEGTPQ